MFAARGPYRYQRLVDADDASCEGVSLWRYVGLMTVAVSCAAALTSVGRQTSARLSYAAGVRLVRTGEALSRWHRDDDVLERCDCGGCGPSTHAPTPDTEDWMLYFSDGADDSHVWYMHEQSAEYSADVLLSTSGSVTGVVADTNNTWLYYGVSDGGVYRVLKSGRSIEAVSSFSGAVTGLAMDPRNHRVFFGVNGSSAAGVYSVNVDCGARTQVMSLDSVWSLAFDQRRTLLYVAALTGAIYVVDSTDYSLVAPVVDGINRLRGIAVDAATRTLFFAAADGVYAMDEDGTNGTRLYAATDVADVAVDSDRDLLFYADSGGLHKGDVTGGEATQLLTLFDIHYVYVVALLAPTPAPTAVPTSLPSPLPTHVPLPVPSPAPTPIPSIQPSSEPTTFCAAIMQTCDLCYCNDSVSPVVLPVATSQAPTAVLRVRF